MAKSKNKSKSINLTRYVGPVIFALVFTGMGYTIRLLTSAATPSSTGSSIVLDQSNTYLGSKVSFTSTYPRIKGGVIPKIAIRCFQDVNGDGKISTVAEDPKRPGLNNPDLVYGEIGSADMSQISATSFILGGPTPPPGSSSGSLWIDRGGAATCNAELFYYNNNKPPTHLAQTADWIAGASQ